MLKHALVLCVVFVAAYSFVERAPLRPKPDKFKDVPGCYIEELDKVIPVGQSSPAKSRCTEYNCGENNVSIFGCGAIAIRPECKKVSDETLPYPDCCPQEKC